MGRAIVFQFQVTQVVKPSSVKLSQVTYLLMRRLRVVEANKSALLEKSLDDGEGRRGPHIRSLLLKRYTLRKRDQ